MSQLSISLFGSPQIEHDGNSLKISRRKAVALLAYLAISQQSHSRDALATMFWPEADQRRARAALRSALWALNKTALEEWLIVEPEMVTLRFERDSSERTLNIDVIRFRELFSASQNHQHAADVICADCVEQLTEAVSLYNNEFMAGFTLPDAPEFDEWQFFQANSLRQNLVMVLENLIVYHREQDNFSDAIPYARRYVALDLLHEAAHQSLMQLYAQAGQQSAALRQYEVCRKTLESELGVEPSGETQLLYKGIRSGKWKVSAKKIGKTAVSTTTIPIHTQPPPIIIPHNLPPDPTPFIGRKRELSDLATFLSDKSTRLLTITGPGGIGKSRLALAAAANQLLKAKFADGVYFVALAPLSESEAVSPAIAEAIGYPFQTDQRSPRQQIFDYLSQKSMFILLDNFEHLLSEEQSDAATFVSELLQHAPQLKILATSREQLNLYEEQRYSLHGLTVAENGSKDAGSDYAAAKLFLQTVRRRQPAFEMTPVDMPCLANICSLVEGMPLALELAASWIELLSLPEIAVKIQQNLDFLETNIRNVPARHRSIQAVFNTSWQSLHEGEQRVYAQLSVFRGGFTQEAAEAVAGASMPTLMRLVNKSLLRFNQGQKRYEHHELLRQYAAEKLADSREETGNRYAAYFCTFLEKSDSGLKGSQQQAVLAAIEADGENVRGAWQWAAAHAQAENLEQGLVSLALFYQWRSRFGEGAMMCETAVSQFTTIPSEQLTETQARLLVKLLTWQAVFYISLTRYDDARQALKLAQAVLNHPKLQDQNVAAIKAFLLLQLVHFSISNEFGGKALALNEESLALYKSIDDDWGTAVALDSLSQSNMNLGLHEKAIQQQEACLAIRQQLGDQRGIAQSYNVLGLLVLHVGQTEKSEVYLRKSLSIFRTMNNRALISSPLAVLGINLLFGGKFEECIASFEECWVIHKALSLTQEPFTANVSMTRAKINLGRYNEARMQAQKQLVAYRRINHWWSIAFTLFNLGRIVLVEGEAEQAERHFQESAEILQKMKERSLLPDVLFCLAFTARALNNRQQAIRYMIQALTIAIETAPLNPMRFELPGMALLLADQGELEQAVEFYAAGLQSGYMANSRWFEDIAGRYISEIGNTLPQDVVAAAQDRGRERNLWTTANVLLANLLKDS
ncbi:MAG: tetratricopeptide repeat protein [Chloroflexi bacterium]|nr:tetratricopeptide repeat protein [Chloroflexota bacterium]